MQPGEGLGVSQEKLNPSQDLGGAAVAEMPTADVATLGSLEGALTTLEAGADANLPDALGELAVVGSDTGKEHPDELGAVAPRSDIDSVIQRMEPLVVGSEPGAGVRIDTLTPEQMAPAAPAAEAPAATTLTGEAALTAATDAAPISGEATLSTGAGTAPAAAELGPDGQPVAAATVEAPQPAAPAAEQGFTQAKKDRLTALEATPSSRLGVEELEERNQLRAESKNTDESKFTQIRRDLNEGKRVSAEDMAFAKKYEADQKAKGETPEGGEAAEGAPETGDQKIARLNEERAKLNADFVDGKISVEDFNKRTRANEVSRSGLTESLRLRLEQGDTLGMTDFEREVAETALEMQQLFMEIQHAPAVTKSIERQLKKLIKNGSALDKFQINEQNANSDQARENIKQRSANANAIAAVSAHAARYQLILKVNVTKFIGVNSKLQRMTGTRGMLKHAVATIYASVAGQFQKGEVSQRARQVAKSGTATPNMAQRAVASI